MLVVGGRRPSQGAGQLDRRAELDVTRQFVPGQARGDFLQKPTVTIRIAKGRIGAITSSLRLQPGNDALPVQVVKYSARVVERLAHRHAAVDHIGSGGLNVGYDEIQALYRTGSSRSDSDPEDDRASRTWRGELYDAILLARGKIYIEPPAQGSVETLSIFQISAVSIFSSA
jgi:hypothetical protein